MLLVSPWRYLFHTSMSDFIGFIRGCVAYARAAETLLWKVLVRMVHEIRQHLPFQKIFFLPPRLLLTVLGLQ